MSSSSLTLAKRRAGVCQGSLIKAVERSGGGDAKFHGSSGSTSSSSYIMSSSTPPKVSEYCVLVGVRLTCYESWMSMDRGHHPTAIYSVVGASAVSNAPDASFRIVTNQGTHLWCCPPSTRCRDLWLRALNAGLERHYNGSTNATTTTTTVTTTPTKANSNADSPSSPSSPSTTSPSSTILQPVKPRYHAANMKNPPSFCLSCGKLERNEFPLLHNCSPLAQYGMESRMNMCPNCSIAQGLLEHVRWLQELNAAQYQEQVALLQARNAILKALCPNRSHNNNDMEDDRVTTHLELSPLSHHILSGVLTSAQCAAYSRLSPTLERLSIQFSQGLIGCIELVELLENAIGIKDQDMRRLKQQAFRVNGDMGTALKLLADHALPKRSSSTMPASSAASNSSTGPDDFDDDSIHSEYQHNSTELLECILEFFLDLLEEGELQSVAFFWPQLLNIHLQMLPPTDAASLQRIELVEDFLLTVSTQYSIQLAIDLIWSHTADLEDAATVAVCAKRKYSVLRFLCELESLLFDIEMGWGGGSVTVGSFLAPSKHQVALLKNAMQSIQQYRLSQRIRLSRSQRYTKISRSLQQRHQDDDEIPPEQLAKEALRIAKNADYVSTHLAYTKRLGDIANRLFHQPVDDRKSILTAELAKLNASGTMGGDPLNRVKLDNHHIRVARIPINEGHVFRSKERTPVLLLVETLDEAAEAMEVKSQLTPFPARRLSNDNINLAEQEEKKSPDEEVEKQTEEAIISSNDTTPAEIVTESITSTNTDGEETTNAEKSVGTEKSLGTQVANGDSNTKPELSISESNGDFAIANLETAVESSTAVSEEPADPKPTPSDDNAENVETPKKDKVMKDVMGSLECLPGEPSSARHALRRFDSPKGTPRKTPTASKESVEALLTNVVAKQLQLPSLIEPTNELGEEEVAQSTLAADDTNIKEATTPDNDGTGTPDQRIKASRMSALGSGGDGALSKTGDTRRAVLNSLMMKGMSGSHSLAAGTATAMQRHLQDLERRRAVELLMTGDEKETGNNDRHELLALGIRSVSREDIHDEVTGDVSSEDNEAMEAIRLLLIQYQVRQGVLTMNDAAKVLAPHHRLRQGKARSEGTIMYFGREFPEIDAGDVDPRLIGCGTLPPAVLQALTLHKANMITNGELLELVKKDLEFVRYSGEVEAHKDKLNEDSAFWGRFAFGERWAEKRSRIAASSPDATKPGWDLIGVIVKANDDLRQEAFVMQLIELCQEAFDEAGLELWMLPYRILSTGRTTGIIEMVRNAMSFDALKKRPGYGKGGLREHLHRMTQYAADPGEAFKSAQRNFVRSLSAYSLLSYLFLFKDRHNGNILLDTAGHVIHIDFGFVFGVAPGGSFSLEISTPFKLTEEMIDVMDGLRSSLFSEFITLFCCGFLALQAHCDTLCTVVDITCKGSTFKCFEGRDPAEVVGKLRERFRPELGKEETIAFCLDLIKDATQSYGTAQYDYFQYLSQGIAT